ncbi:AraC family transcriptional regulator [Pseudomonas syringae pv. antirrhini]|uniref:AraC family transcriptional regulator n=2 Tax=Pseudomonas syringae group TaxID=136849 RepID=A0A0P9P3R0_9PSED|nr:MULTISPECIES: AraC family transcriptional regulator [Pseudomonas]KPW27629.1 AraC family transcriptional regulator [Pseudomonas syringae pv. apii]KPW51465.1 AraC family transcriptional regulator [Pseudomonas syringae pv. antirrhini]RMO90637.1 AraC family transcriptional regulator [Pseudomonas syringae pv. tagetis]RMP33812.1 AraC family transcriptional regulator [Pseudomonas syringae pv. antirrhini]RMP38706.1 AraC family transcriptional regulator [Pseudomonas syringae pv. antirrhini]
MSSASRHSTTATDIARLAERVGQIIHSEGDHFSEIPGLSFHRRSAVTVPLHCIYSLGLGLTLQGGKQVMVGDDALTYDPGQSMVTSVDIPVIANVTKASFAQPFIGMILKLDGGLVVQVAERLKLSQRMKDESFRPVTVHALESSILGALERLVGLLDEPQLISSLSPLIIEEIVIRLLNGPHGLQLLHIVSAGSPSQHIAKAVEWLKLHFREPLKVDDLATAACMSPSTFRQHFRTVTGMSPLQYQKQLRLQAARQMMLSQNVDASSAGGLVGYESSSQFSREYSRLFGEPPQRDIKRMRPQ